MTLSRIVKTMNLESFRIGGPGALGAPGSFGKMETSIIPKLILANAGLETPVYRIPL